MKKDKQGDILNSKSEFHKQVEFILNLPFTLD